MRDNALFDALHGLMAETHTFYLASGFTVGRRLNDSSKLEPSAAHPHGDALYPRADTAVFTARQTDGGWYFVCDGKYLTSAKTGNYLYWNTKPTDYSIWNPEAAGTDGLVNLVNLNAVYYGKPQALEYYNGVFTSYSGTTADAFRFRVYAVPDHVWGEPTVTVPATCETAGSAYRACVLCGNDSGRITGGYCTMHGGGINVTGGSSTENSATFGGVWVGNTCTFNMNGGTITGNRATF